jgi:hypothetical protein
MKKLIARLRQKLDRLKEMLEINMLKMIDTVEMNLE